MTDPHGRPDDDGFSLVEVLVAFAILALALGGMQAALAASTRVQADLARRDATLRDARSRLDHLLAGPLSAGSMRGTNEAGAPWRSTVTLLPRATTTRPIAVVPARVVVTVADSRGRDLIRLESIGFASEAQ